MRRRHAGSPINIHIRAESNMRVRSNYSSMKTNLAFESARVCMCIGIQRREWKLMQKAARINYSNSLNMRAVAMPPGARLVIKNALAFSTFSPCYYSPRRRLPARACRLELVSWIFLHRKSAKPCVSLDLYARNASRETGVALTFCSLMTHWAPPLF